MTRRNRNANGTGRRWLEAHVGYRGADCLIWPYSCCTPGYGQLAVTIGGKMRHTMAHRFMCELVHGPAPEGHEAAHSCGNRRCCNPAHLSWKTVSGNQYDRTRHGTHNTWGRRGKLKPIQIEQIRQLKGVEKSIETAAKYGITESNVRLIQAGKTWQPRKLRDWTDEEHAELVRALAAGTPLENLAAKMGRTFGSVRARAYNTGLLGNGQS